MGRRTRATIVGGALAAATTLTGCDPGPSPWRVELVTVNAAGEVGTAPSTAPVFSPDGTKMAFTSSADNFGSTDTNLCGGLPPFIPHGPCADVYVRDLATGATTLVSVNGAGTNSGNFGSDSPVFSPDGTKIAFASLAGDLGPTDTVMCGNPPFPVYSCHDLYLRDLVAGTTTLISASVTGDGSNAGNTRGHAFSPDGSKILFVSNGGNIVPGDTNADYDVFVHDLATGTTSLVSANQAGVASSSGAGVLASFTDGGGSIVFTSAASDIVAGDTNNASDLFVRDIAAATTTLVTTNAAGTASANGDSSFQGALGSAQVSADGRLVTFASDASDLVATDTNGAADVFVRDLTTGVTSLVSANAAGTDSGAGSSTSPFPTISADGTKVVFASNSNELGPPNPTGTDALFVRDLGTGVTEMVSVNVDGTDNGNNQSLYPVVSPDGRRVTFQSYASDLGSVDDHRFMDVYVRDLDRRATTLVSATPSGRSGGADSTWSTFSPDSTQVAFVSAAYDLDPADDDGNANTDIFLATLHGADVRVTAAAGPDPVPSGGVLSYDLQVANDGPDASEGSGVGLLLPAGTAFAAASTSSGTCAAPTPPHPSLVTCDLGDLGVGDTVDVTVTVDVGAPGGSSLTATAILLSDSIDPVTADNTIHITSTVG